MFAHIMTASLLGLECDKVWAEADVEDGLSNFSIVGLANRSIRESKERVRSAITNCGFEFPDIRITVNLTPAGINKNGSHFDLAIALAILISNGEIVPNCSTEDVAFLGELSLDGNIRKVNGLLPMVIGLRRFGIRHFVIPSDNFSEASLVTDVDFFPADHLLDVIDLIECGDLLRFQKADIDQRILGRSTAEDFADIKGQESLKRAAAIAAAGFHGMLIIGPPGVGKSMIGKRIPGIMPPMTYNQQLDVTQIYSVAGMLSDEMPIVSERPFRSPHHSATVGALVGGGANPLPGEVSLAHHGVLFLDELPEFPTAVLETLRQPLEDGKVSITRAAGKCTYPSRFMLVAAMNPCKCGYYGDPVKRCSCTETDRQRYLNRVSGPLLDRIDLHMVAKRPSYDELFDKQEKSKYLDTKALRSLVEKANAIQKERYKKMTIEYNSELTPPLITKYCMLDADASELMDEAFCKWNLSARAYHKILKLSRTIADIGESEKIEADHLLEAFNYRLPEQFFKR